MNKKDIYIFLNDENFIRIVTPDDVNESYLETLADNQSLKYMGNARNNPMKLSSLCEYIDDQYYNETSYLFGLFENRQLIATSRVHDVVDQQAWQGVLVFMCSRGKKRGQILVKNVSDFSLKNLGILKLNAGILKENIASQKIFSRSGFIHERDDTDYQGRQIWVKTLA